MTVRLSWEATLAWRMRRHFLDPVADVSVAEVVDRLCGVQAQVASSAELAVRVRQRDSPLGEVNRAMADGRLIKTWAMRGTLHLLTPDEGAAFLALVAAGRSWERPSWQRYFGATPDVMERLREVVRDVLTGGALTREELVAEISGRPGVEHLADGLRSGWGTLLKPLAWQGDLVFGPSRGNRVTFMLPEQASDRWAGVPPVEEAAPVAIAAYLRAYAPIRPETFGDWLAGGWFGKRQLRGWFQLLGDRLSEVEVDGEPYYALAEDVDELRSATPTKTVRLLPGFDQYVLGPGTGDGRVTPAARRAAVSKQSGWISPVVVAGGVVRGTWELADDAASVSWFEEAGCPPAKELEQEVARLSSILGRSLGLALSVRAL